MRMRFMQGAVGLLAASAVSPVAAQLRPETVTGSRIPSSPQEVEAGQAAAIRNAFAQCAYRKDPKAAAALLANSDPVKVDLARAGIKNLHDRFGLSRCLGDEVGVDQSALGLRMPLSLVRLLLAEQAYLAAVRQPPTLPANAVEKVDRPFVTEGDALAKAQGLAAFSDCVVFQNVVGADTLIRTAPGSAAEIAAAQSLAPALGACLVQGQNITLNARSIRMFVADGLWSRFVQAPAR